MSEERAREIINSLTEEELFLLNEMLKKLMQ